MVLVGLLNSIAGFTFEKGEITSFRTFEKFSDEIRRIDEAIVAGVGPDIQVALEKRRAILMNTLADPRMMTGMSSYTSYYQVSGIFFIVGLIVEAYPLNGLTVNYKAATQADFAAPIHGTAPKISQPKPALSHL
jgi:hypothetical protein